MELCEEAGIQIQPYTGHYDSNKFETLSLAIRDFYAVLGNPAMAYDARIERERLRTLEMLRSGKDGKAVAAAVAVPVAKGKFQEDLLNAQAWAFARYKNEINPHIS